MTPPKQERVTSIEVLICSLCGSNEIVYEGHPDGSGDSRCENCGELMSAEQATFIPESSTPEGERLLICREHGEEQRPSMGRCTQCARELEVVVVRADSGEGRLREEVVRLQSANDEKAEAINAALDELGIPNEGYPSPVANAVDILSRVVVRKGSGPPVTPASSAEVQSPPDASAQAPADSRSLPTDTPEKRRQHG